MARSTFPMSARKTISQCWVPPAAIVPSWPLLFASKGEFIGMLNARRIDVRPFTATQIKLLETFADQAVIAIENVRLFQELKESLEQQTATSEILGVIASSPTDIQPVLDTIAQSAARVCGSDDATIRLIEGEHCVPGGTLRDDFSWSGAQDIVVAHARQRGHATAENSPHSGHASGGRENSRIAERAAIRTIRVVSEPFLRAVAAGRDGHRCDKHPPHGGEALYRQADRVTEDLCRRPSSPSRTCGCSTNSEESESDWSSKPRRVKFWAL